MARRRIGLDERYLGSTKPRRHRVRRGVVGLLFAAIALCCVLVIAVVARSVITGVGTQPTATPAVVISEASSNGAPASNKDQSAEEPEPEPVTLDLMMIGDLLMHEGVIESGNHGDGTYSYEHLFSHISSDIEAADVAILNQETILGGPADRKSVV